MRRDVKINEAKFKKVLLYLGINKTTIPFSEHETHYLSNGYNALHVKMDNTENCRYREKKKC